MKHAISMKWVAHPNRGYSHFPHDFESSYEFLNSLWKWRFLCSLNGHVVTLMTLIVEPRMFILFWTRSPTSFKHIMSLWYSLLKPHQITCHSLRYRCSNKKSSWIRVVYRICIHHYASRVECSFLNFVSGWFLETLPSNLKCHVDSSKQATGHYI
jgi:hypothetical protein